ncbi:hypothetical protein VTK56DRAFT_4364 [Thermocarpiscus australiensis]
MTLNNTMDRPTAAPPTPALPPSYIKPMSPFPGLPSQCCQCSEPTTTDNRTTRPHCSACTHRLCPSCPSSDDDVSSPLPLPEHYSFPAAWLCGTCGAAHSVLEILTQRVADCACASPALRAVYDQFGRLFLWWRDDPAVSDLRDPDKVREAAWRVREAGADEARF